MSNSYDHDTPAFAVFYTGTSDGETHSVAVRAATAEQAREGFELRAGDSATVRLVAPLVDVTHT